MPESFVAFRQNRCRNIHKKKKKKLLWGIVPPIFKAQQITKYEKDGIMKSRRANQEPPVGPSETKKSEMMCECVRRYRECIEKESDTKGMEEKTITHRKHAE